MKSFYTPSCRTCQENRPTLRRPHLTDGVSKKSKQRREEKSVRRRDSWTDALLATERTKYTKPSCTRRRGVAVT